jgi:peptidyl-prolyl cis-trans isomerase B (cyclophilin B)
MASRLATFLTLLVIAAVCALPVLAGSALAAGSATTAPQPTPMSSGMAHPTAAPTVSAPTPSAPNDSPFGIIGNLERNRKTQPSALKPYLQSPDAVVQARAAIAIGRLHNAAGVPLLVAVLGGAYPESVRAAAAFGLGVIASPDALDALHAAALHASPAVAGPAADALGRIGGDAAVDVLTQLLYSRDAYVRGKAAIGLGLAGLTGKPEITIARKTAIAKTLASVISSERNPETKWRLAWAIYRSYATTSGSVLRYMLTDSQELVRLMALKAIAKVKDRTFAVSVRLLANDPSWRVRVEVRNALDAMKDPTPVNLTPPPVPRDDQTEPNPLPSGAPIGDHPQVAIVANKGVIVVELFPDVAPYHVDAFLNLVDKGFYNGTTINRVIWDFVIQGGDPSNGKANLPSGPGFNVPDEVNPVEQLTGMLALGLDYDNVKNTPIFDSAGSQYYITQSPQLHLDEFFSTFGRVVKGMAVVYAIQKHDPSDFKNPSDVVARMYRCEPVSLQTPEIEAQLRTDEVHYNPQ